MKASSSQPSTTCCCEVTHGAGHCRVEAEMTVASSLPAQQQAHGLLSIHPQRLEQAQDRKQEEPAANLVIYEQTQERNSIESHIGNDVYNSSSVQNPPSSAASVFDQATVLSDASRPSSTAAGFLLTLSVVDPDGAFWLSNAVCTQGRHRQDQSSPSPLLVSCGVSKQQASDSPALRSSTASVDAVDQAAERKSAGTQKTVEHPLPVAAETASGEFVPTEGEFKRGRGVGAQICAKALPAAALDTTAAPLVDGGQSRALIIGEKCREKGWEHGKRPTAEACIREETAWTCSTRAQHHTCEAQPSLPGWPPQLEIGLDNVEQQQSHATLWKKETCGSHPQKGHSQSGDEPEDVALRQQQQPEEDTVYGTHTQEKHTVHRQERELQPYGERREAVQPLPVLQDERCQTRGTCIDETASSQGAGFSVETSMKHQFRGRQRSSSSLSTVQPADRSARQRSDSIAEGGGGSAKEWAVTALYEEYRTDASFVVARGATRTSSLCGNGRSSDRLGGVPVVRNERSESQERTSREEEVVVERDGIALEDSALRESGGNAAATGRTWFVSSFFARNRNDSVGEASSHSIKTNFGSCPLMERRGEVDCEIKEVSREHTINRMESTPRGSSSTANPDQRLLHYGDIQQPGNTIREEVSTFHDYEGHENWRRSNSERSRARSPRSSVDGFCSTSLGKDGIGDIAEDGGVIIRDSAALRGRDSRASGSRLTSGDEDSSACAETDQKVWHRCTGQSACPPEKRPKTQLAWLPSALLNIVDIIPRCAVAVRTCLGHRKCPTRHAVAVGGVPSSTEEACAKRWAKKQNSSGVGEARNRSGQQEGDKCRVATEVRDKAQAMETFRALFECCIPPAPASALTPLGLSRYVLLCVYTLQAFLTGCVYFGWPALSSMLYRSGAYAWLCSPSELAGTAGDGDASIPAAPSASRPYLCNSQDAAVAPLFTVCHVSDCVMCILAGYLTDRCSPKKVCILGQSLHVIGWTLLACSSVRFPAYVPAMIFIGCGCATAYLPLLRVALLFPRRKATTIAILGAANTGSFAVPCILDAIWRQIGVRTNDGAASALGSATPGRGMPSGEGAGTTAGVIDGVLLKGGSAGGEGWTFTDICMLYLGIGPICCMLLAAFFLPSHRFSSPCQDENARKGGPHGDGEVEDEEHRKRWSMLSATDAVLTSGPATASGSDVLAPTAKAGMEEEGSSASSVAFPWKVWKVFCQASKGKETSVDCKQQQLQFEPCRSRHVLGPFSRHRERNWWRLHCLHKAHCIERRMQQQQFGDTGEAAASQANVVLKQGVSQKDRYCGTSFRVAVVDEGERRVESQGESCRDDVGNDGKVQDNQRLPKDKQKGGCWRGCTSRIDLFSGRRRSARSTEGQHNIARTKVRVPPSSGSEETQEAAAATQMDQHAEDVLHLSGMAWEQGVPKYTQQMVGSARTTCRTAKSIGCAGSDEAKTVTEGSHVVTTVRVPQIKTCNGGAYDIEAATHSQDKAVANDFHSNPCRAAQVLVQSSLGYFLHEEANLATSQKTEYTRVKHVPSAGADGESPIVKLKEPLRREEHDCRLLPNVDGETSTHFTKDNPETLCCEAKPSADVSGTSRECGVPMEKRTTDECNGKGKKWRCCWLASWKFPACGVCAARANGRQVVSLDKDLEKLDVCTTKKANDRIPGRRCNSIEGHKVDKGTLQGAVTEVSLRKVQREATGGRAASPQTTRNAKYSSNIKSSKGFGASFLPSLQILTHECAQATTAQAVASVTIEGEARAVAESKATRAQEETPVIATAYNRACPEKRIHDARTVIACPAAITVARAAACGASDTAAHVGIYVAGVECVARSASPAATPASRAPDNTGDAFSSTIVEIPDAGYSSARTCHAPDLAVVSTRPTSEFTRKEATLFSQCLSLHFICVVFYSGIVSVALSFMQSSSSRLFSAKELAFMDWALPFSFIPCILLGRLIDMFGPFPVLLFMNSMGLLSYLCAATTPLEGMHYISVLAFCVYVSLDSEQVYCYVEYTFRSEHFGRLSGMLMAIDGSMSLVSIPLYDHLTVRKLGGNPLPVAFGISGLLGGAYVLLTGLWLHRRKYPDPFGRLESDSVQRSPAWNKQAAETEEHAELEVEKMESQAQSNVYKSPRPAVDLGGSAAEEYQQRPVRREGGRADQEGLTHSEQKDDHPEENNAKKRAEDDVRESRGLRSAAS